MSSTTEPPPPYKIDEVESNATDSSPQNDSRYVMSRASPYNTAPIEMDCPHCQNHIVSHIEHVAGVLPWILFSILAFLGLFLFIVPWCFCCVPFFLDQLLDVNHLCPACKKFLGRFSRV
uniref:LITAF domain-containing protein n=1 Tax=Caenorhabditis japonica TaxID=281687 RepID=A0A8R1IWG6_CAEJA